MARFTYRQREISAYIGIFGAQLAAHVVDLAGHLNAGVVRLMEGGVAVLVGAVRPGTVAAVEVASVSPSPSFSKGHGER